MSKIAIYVQSTGYAKSVYSIESYSVRLFPGIEMVRADIERLGYTVEYCSSANVGNYDIVLVSIVSQCDWPSFIAERITWGKIKGKIIIGGTGVLNVLPFLEYGDFFWLGRGDGDIGVFVKELLDNGAARAREHVIERGSFSITHKYTIRQSTPFAGTCKLADGSNFNETTIGCQRKCFFCSYTWHRKFTGGLQKDSGVFSGNSEKTMFEIIEGGHDNLSALRMVGLDGISERLRRMVNKPITNKMIVEFAKLLSSNAKPHHVKIYNICGYWNEADGDYADFAKTVIACDGAMTSGKFCFELHSTPFRPMPATPMACCATKYENYRGKIQKTIRNYTGKIGDNSVFYNGKNLFALETMGTESLATVFLDMIALRGELGDAENYRKVSCSPKFVRADTKTKIITLEKYFNAAKLFGWYTPEELPTRCIQSHAKIDQTKYYSHFRNLTPTPALQS